MRFGVHTGGNGHGRPPAEVSQVDLENALLFSNRAQEQRELLGRVAASVRDRLRGGAAVECGVHNASLGEFTLGGVHYEALMVDGRALVVWAAGELEDLRRVFWV